MKFHLAYNLQDNPVHLPLKLNSEAKLQRATVSDLEYHLGQAFSKARSYETQNEKIKARNYIKEFFEYLAEEYSTDVIVQRLSFEDLTCEDGTCTVSVDL